MILPIQKLKHSEKLARSDANARNNYEETIDFYIESCSFNDTTEEIASLFRAIEGHLDVSSYKEATNPYNKKKKDNTDANYNVTLENFNILKGIANLLMGEFGRRTHEYVVATLSPKDEFTYKKGLDFVIKNFYSQQIANTLMEMGMDLGQTVVESLPLEEQVAKFKDSFEDTRILSGQDILDFIVFNCDLDNKYIDLYWDWIITGRAYTFKEVNHDDVYFEVVPSHELYVPYEPNNRFVEDRSYAVRRMVLPITAIIDKFRGRIPEDLIDAMEQRVVNGLTSSYSSVQPTGRRGAMILPTTYTSNSNDNFFNKTTNIGDGIELFHVEYKTFRAYQELTYLDPYSGIERVMEVGEDYELDKSQGDISLELKWENQIVQGYKCLDFYLDVEPLATNRADLNQEGLQKLSYNGICERSFNGSVQSIIKDGLPYQRSVNMAHYQVQKMVNKNKDKLLVLPYELIPSKQGIDAKNQMYLADSTSILWIDGTVPGAANAAQMIKTVDLSLGTYIQEQLNRIKFIKSEYWESIGMNAQRYSDVSQGAGKAVTEQAIVRSAIITYEMTRQFESLIRKDYQGLLDISKQAYIKGKKAKYVRSDGALAFINLDEDGATTHSESSYNIFVKDSAMLSEGIQALRGQIQALIQNGAPPELAAGMYETNSITRLTKMLREMKESMQAREDQIAETTQQNQLALQDKLDAAAKEERDFQYYKVDKLLEGVKYSADARKDNSGNDNDIDNNNDDFSLDSMLANHKVNKENRELQQKDQEIDIKRKALNKKTK